MNPEDKFHVTESPSLDDIQIDILDEPLIVDNGETVNLSPDEEPANEEVEVEDSGHDARDKPKRKRESADARVRRIEQDYQARIQELEMQNNSLLNESNNIRTNLTKKTYENEAEALKQELIIERARYQIGMENQDPNETLDANVRINQIMNRQTELNNLKNVPTPTNYIAAPSFGSRPQVTPDYEDAYESFMSKNNYLDRKQPNFNPVLEKKAEEIMDAMVDNYKLTNRFHEIKSPGFIKELDRNLNEFMRGGNNMSSQPPRNNSNNYSSNQSNYAPVNASRSSLTKPDNRVVLTPDEVTLIKNMCASADQFDYMKKEYAKKKLENMKKGMTY